MRKQVLILALGLSMFLGSWAQVRAQESATPTEPPTELTQTIDRYERGRVIEILEEGTIDLGERSVPYQVVKARLETGNAAGTEVTINHGRDYSHDPRVTNDSIQVNRPCGHTRNRRNNENRVKQQDEGRIHKHRLNKETKIGPFPCLVSTKATVCKFFYDVCGPKKPPHIP